MPDTSSTQDLDLSLLHEIADGSDEFIVESISLFLQQTPESLQDIDNGINSKNWIEVASAAHKLKATLGFFGMINSQSLIQDIEQISKSVKPSFADVSLKFKQIQAYMADNINTLIVIRTETAAKL